MTRERDPELLVVSDTHGDAAELARVFRWAKQRKTEMVAFLGDGIPDLARASERAAFNPLMRVVRGNGDADPSIPFERLIDFFGLRVLMAHGHLFGVQETLDSIVFNARTGGAAIALFGHTHYPFNMTVRGIRLVNPGSLSRPRYGAAPSFATLSRGGEGEISVVHWRIDGGSIREYDLAPPAERSVSFT